MVSVKIFSGFEPKALGNKSFPKCVTNDNMLGWNSDDINYCENNHPFFAVL